MSFLSTSHIFLSLPKHIPAPPPSPRVTHGRRHGTTIPDSIVLTRERDGVLTCSVSHRRKTSLKQKKPPRLIFAPVPAKSASAGSRLAKLARSRRRTREEREGNKYGPKDSPHPRASTPLSSRGWCLGTYLRSRSQNRAPYLSTPRNTTDKTASIDRSIYGIYDASRHLPDLVRYLDHPLPLPVEVRQRRQRLLRDELSQPREKQFCLRVVQLGKAGLTRSTQAAGGRHQAIHGGA